MTANDSPLGEWRRFAHDDMRAEVAEGRGAWIFPKRHVPVISPYGGGERFARLFRETWDRIPLGPRRSMLKYWRTECILPVAFQPTIYLMPEWKNRRGGNRLKGDMACMTHLGHVLNFHARTVAKMPDEIVRDLISHELAHVVQRAEWDDFDNEDAFTVEESADATMEMWGFSSTNIDKWTLSVGITKVLELDKMSPTQKARFFKKVQKNGR